MSQSHPNHVGIFYFSGTGNTKTVAEILDCEFQKHGTTVSVIAIDELLKNNRSTETNQYDLIGFGYPVHAFNAPRIFFEFIKTLPGGEQKKTFVFKTAGDPFMNGGSTALIRRALQKKGYVVCYERLFVMPANVVFRYKDQLIKQLYTTAVRRAQRMVYDVLSGVTLLQKNTFFSTVATAAFSYMEGYGARFFGKHLVASSSCNLCSVCIEKCPTNNITIQKNHITFNSKCVLCMRCIYGCPLKAVSPRYLQFLVIKEWYNLQKIVNNPAVKDTYITSTTKGYFRHYYRYFSES